jgi:hypothetical protein
MSELIAEESKLDKRMASIRQAVGMKNVMFAKQSETFINDILIDLDIEELVSYLYVC